MIKSCESCVYFKPRNNNFLLFIPVIGWIAWVYHKVRPTKDDRRFSRCFRPSDSSFRVTETVYITGKSEKYTFCTVERDPAFDALNNVCGTTGRFWEPSDSYMHNIPSKNLMAESFRRGLMNCLKEYKQEIDNK